MSTFTTPPRLEPVWLSSEDLDVRYVDGRFWKLLAPFEFASQTTERIIRVPAGFLTDFASIPRVLQNILPPAGPYGKAAVIHDVLYQNPEAITPWVTRAQADGVLLEGMVALRVKILTRWVVYLGVRLGGWVPWGAYRRRKG